MFPNYHVSLIKQHIVFIFRNMLFLMWHTGVYINWLELLWQLWHEPLHHWEETLWSCQEPLGSLAT